MLEKSYLEGEASIDAYNILVFRLRMENRSTQLASAFPLVLCDKHSNSSSLWGNKRLDDLHL